MGRLNELLTLAQGRARELNLAYEGALTPKETYEVMQISPRARLIDVRTVAEWEWVGRIPNAIEIEWQNYPERELNPHFLKTLKHAVTPESMLLFICRSGVRSSYAAQVATEAGFPDCYNVLEGFEGDKDVLGRRNSIGGWRVAGLPWHQ
jgi:rhodanese-related sulfurtransferase